MTKPSENAKVVAESVDISSISPADLTTDCHYVFHESGRIDIIRGYTMTKIFDYMHDRGHKIVKIEVTGGRLNPKTQTPRIEG